jgi:L-ascorbate metabolism protein UlaG (beta-lactamase superfamily)
LAKKEKARKIGGPSHLTFPPNIGYNVEEKEGKSMSQSYLLAVAVLSGFLMAAATFEASDFERDTFPTAQGDLVITFIGHGTLMLEWGGETIHVDPVGSMADYSRLPKADLILVTHEHSDHFDLKAVRLLSKEGTRFIGNAGAAEKIAQGTVMKNGQTLEVQGIKIEAVPAYNIVHMRSPGNPYHPKGQGNGYILTLADKRIYIAGDTENIPEMKALRNIDVAFLPMNLPFTMTPEMVADAARAFRPKVLYPYHYGDTDPSRLTELLKNEPAIEVRVRRMQ